MKKLLVVLFVCIFILISRNAFAVTLLYDTFDAENGGITYGNYNNFQNWDVVSGAVDLLGPNEQGYYINPMPSWVGSFVDLDGTDGGGGRLVSKEEFRLLPGLLELQFDIQGAFCPYSYRTDELNDILIVSLGNIYSETFTIPQNYPFTTITRNIDIQRQTDGRLIFDQTAGHDNMGPLLDNIWLTRNVSPVPEPATLSLFGLGLLGCSIFRRKKENKC